MGFLVSHKSARSQRIQLSGTHRSLCRPTEENVRRFCADCREELYQAFFLAWVLLWLAEGPVSTDTHADRSRRLRGYNLCNARHVFIQVDVPTQQTPQRNARRGNQLSRLGKYKEAPRRKAQPGGQRQFRVARHPALARADGTGAGGAAHPGAKYLFMVLPRSTRNFMNLKPRPVQLGSSFKVCLTPGWGQSVMHDGFVWCVLLQKKIRYVCPGAPVSRMWLALVWHACPECCSSNGEMRQMTN